ncbi:MAG: uracil-DNA glycosylase, partial [Gammaproteobacteria bacterium]|nr:uracil-DNA glycosylase [Gammaproteobacteria bacterium]
MASFNLHCSDCPRLATFLAGVRKRYPDYHSRPVEPFGDNKARLLVVGLAPGMHGANRSGRPFTGDYAGILLYQTLYKYGFASAPESVATDDGLKLLNCRITNAVKCLPPENKPTGQEAKTCNRYLRTELEDLPKNSVVLALGSIAHSSVLRAHDLTLSAHKFAHGAVHRLNEHRILLDSYHCSRYNTQTRRLTPKMFQTVFQKAREILDTKP